MSNTLPDEIQQQLHREISKEVQRNVNTQVAPELIPFHALPIYKESSDLILNKDEMDIIIGGEFRQALSKQGNAISKSAEVLEDERLSLLAGAKDNENPIIEIDLPKQVINRPNGVSIKFDIDEFRKKCLLEGLDDISLTLENKTKIETYESERDTTRPWL